MIEPMKMNTLYLVSTHLVLNEALNFQFDDCFDGFLYKATSYDMLDVGRKDDTWYQLLIPGTFTVPQ